VALFKILLEKWPGGTEKNHETSTFLVAPTENQIENF